MKRPAFQFYHGDWMRNANLRRCTFALRGVWIDTMCLLADSDEHGVLRWPLAELANAVGCRVTDLAALRGKGVLKGADVGERMEALTYTPRHAGKVGETVTLLPAQDGPIWYSSRMVRDEYVRTLRATQGQAEAKPKGGIGEPIGGHPSRDAGARASASSSAEKNPKPTVGLPPDGAAAGETPKAKARREAREAGGRAIAYLNAKAGTRFQLTEANLRFAVGRILYDGASEKDLQAVVDLKCAEAAKGDFNRKYLRPATLFGAEKFSQYIGQVGMGSIAAPTAAPSTTIMVSLQAPDSSSSRCLTSFNASGKVDPWDVVKRTGNHPSLRRELMAHKGYVLVEAALAEGMKVLGKYSASEIEQGLR